MPLGRSLQFQREAGEPSARFCCETAASERKQFRDGGFAHRWTFPKIFSSVGGVCFGFLRWDRAGAERLSIISRAASRLFGRCLKLEGLRARARGGESRLLFIRRVQRASAHGHGDLWVMHCMFVTPSCATLLILSIIRLNTLLSERPKAIDLMNIHQPCWICLQLSRVHRNRSLTAGPLVLRPCAVPFCRGGFRALILMYLCRCASSPRNWRSMG